MEPKIKDNSFISDEKLAANDAGHHSKKVERNHPDKEEQADSSQFGVTPDDKPQSNADKASITTGLNEDKSTVSDTSAPSGNV